MAAPIPPRGPGVGPTQGPNQGPQQPQPTMWERGKSWLSSFVTTPKEPADAQKMDQMRGKVKPVPGEDDLALWESNGWSDVALSLEDIDKQVKQIQETMAIFKGVGEAKVQIKATVETTLDETNTFIGEMQEKVKQNRNEFSEQLSKIMEITSEFQRRAQEGESPEGS